MKQRFGRTVTQRGSSAGGKHQLSAPNPRNVDELAHRYGKTAPAGKRRVLLIVAAVFALIASVAGIGWLAFTQTRPQATSRLLSYEHITDRSVTVRFQVDRAAGVAVTCEIQARGDDRLVVGRRLVRIPPSSRTALVLSETIETTARPHNAELVGCRGLDQKAPK